MSHDNYRHHNRPYALLVVPVLMVAGLLALALVIYQLRAAFDPDLREAQRQALYRQQDIDAQVSWVDPFIAVAWRALPLVALGGALFVALAIAYRRFAVHIYIARDKEIAMMQARMQSFPTGLHSLSFHDSHKELPPADDPPALPAPPNVIKARDEWMQWIDEQPHTLLAGKTKAGKTWLATAILESRLRRQEPVFIIDPHSSGWLGLPTAGSLASDGELQRALMAVLNEYLSRLEMRERYKRETGNELPHDHWPRMTVLIDEANSIADDLKTVWTTICKQMASGSRKVGISLLLMAQSPLVEDLNISGAMRANFAAVALDELSVERVIRGESDKLRRDALRDALIDLERPAAALIGSKVWLLDRDRMTTGSAPRNARDLVWRGWDFQHGCRVPRGELNMTSETIPASVRPSGMENTPLDTPTQATSRTDGRTDGTMYVQDKALVYLRWFVRQGKTRDDARAWFDARGLDFQNKLYTEARRLEGKRS